MATRIPPKTMAKKLVRTLRPQHPDYHYLKKVFQHTRDLLAVGLGPRPQRLPDLLTEAELVALYEAIWHAQQLTHLVMLKLLLYTGIRNAELVWLRLTDVDLQTCHLRIDQGKGRKDRYVYLSSDAAARLQACVAVRPAGIPADAVFWNRKRPRQPLSVKAIQKKMERYAKAAGIEATCHQLRHTFASNLLEHGAEIVTIKDLLGHESVHSSERYARVSNRKVKQEYVRTMKKVIRQTKV